MRPTLLTFLLLSIVATCVIAAPWQLLPAKVFTERQCLMCRFSVSLINYSLKTQKGTDQVYRVSNSFCALAHLESPIICSNITRLFNQEIVEVLSYALFTPDQICGFLSNNTCGHYHDPLSDWEVDLNVSISLNQDAITKMRQAEQAHLEPRKPFKVVHLSDIHVDLKYKEGSVSNCEQPLCCRSTSTINTNRTVKAEAGFWGTYSNCDVPLRTLESTLKAINATMAANNDITYVIWTGDIQPHDVWIQEKQSAIATYDQVFAKVFEYLPNARILPTLGNHEMVPVDQFSPSNMLNIAREKSPEWLYKKLDIFWSRWLPAETVSTITKDGFYAFTVQPGLKIISLNTNFCHNTNFWLFINSTDPGNQLQWLIHELQISELDHEQVLIIGHIPPGTVDCLKVWSKNFNKIIRRFAHIIGGQFYGHTHNGEFEIFYDKVEPIDSNDKQQKRVKANTQDLWKPISVGFVGPSVTTFIGLNPGFRVYTIDPNQGHAPIDIETYFMNITAANIHGSNLEPEWTSAGLFSHQFEINDTSPLSLHKLLLDIVKELKAEDIVRFSGITSLSEPITGNGDIYHLMDPNDSKLYKLYRFYKSYSDTFNKADFDRLQSDEKRKFLCRFVTSQAHDNQPCDKFVRGDMITFNDA